MLRITTPRRVTSVALAFVLACTLMPADSIAFAVENASSNAENASQNSSAEQSANGATSTDASTRPTDITSFEYPINTSSSASAESVVSEDVQLAETNSAPAVSVPATATDGTPVDKGDVEIVSASVQLGQNAAIISYNNLTYMVNADSPSTVALVGWSGTMPEGQLNIPSAITYNEQIYAVTAIKNLGGGYNSELNSGEDSTQENPYTTEYYTDADKAHGVTSIALPSTVEEIDPAFFQLFPNATKLDVAKDNPSYKSYNGMLLNADSTSLLLVPEGMEGVAVLPNDLATVPACVFSRCTKLSAISFTPGSTDNASFTTRNGILYTQDMTALLAAPAGLGASATIAPECTHIAEGAFWGNTSLQTIVNNGNIKDIFAEQNQNASDTQQIKTTPAFNPSTIQNTTVQTTNKEAWEKVGFTNFAEPAKPGTSTGPTEEESGLVYTLLDDYTLSVSFKGESPTQIDIPAQSEIDGISYTVSTLVEEAFKDQTTLEQLTIPETITTIGTSAFENCTSLKEIAIPGSIDTIAANTFANCTSLSNVTLSEGIKHLAPSAFENAGIQQITLPTSIQTLQENTFANCSNLKTIVALGSIEEVSATAISGCSGLEIYTPYQNTSWSAGLPASGNSIYEYGIKPAKDNFELKPNESVNIFVDGGYLYAPGSAQVNMSYRASSVSVDSEGNVVAKQPGSAPVNISVNLGDICLAKATANISVKRVSIPEIPAENTSEETAEPATTTDEESIDNANEGESEEELIVAEAPVNPDSPEAAGKPNVINQTLSLTRPGDETVSAEDIEAIKQAEEQRIQEEEAAAAKKASEAAAKAQREAEEAAAEEISAEVVRQQNEAAIEMAENETAAAEEVDAETVEVEDATNAETELDENANATEDAISGDLDSSSTEVDGDSSISEDDSQQSTESVIAELATFGALPTVLDNFVQSISEMNGAFSGIATLATQTGMAHNPPYSVTIDPNGGYWQRIIYSGTAWDTGLLGSAISTSGGSTSTAPLSFSYYSNGSCGSRSTNGSGYFHHGVRNKELTAQGYKGYGETTTGYQVFLSSADVYRTGYTCLGFSEDKMKPIYPSLMSGGIIWSSISSPINANGKTIYAFWKANSYTITFDKQDGSGGSNSTTVDYDCALPNISVPSRIGYTFEGYYTTASGGTKCYNSNGTPAITKWQTAKDTTLYAHWSPIKYTMTIKPNGGTFEDGTTADKSTEFYITTNGVSVSNPSIPKRNGYVFGGWILTGDMVTKDKGSYGSSGLVTSPPTPYYWFPTLESSGWWGSVTYTAYWISVITLYDNLPPSYESSNDKGTIYYYPSYGYQTNIWYGSTIYEQHNSMITNANTALANAPSYTGYTFTGYYSDRKKEVDANNNSTKKLTNECKLVSNVAVAGGTIWYAHWSIITYKVNLDTYGGTLSAGSSEFNYTVETNLAIPTVSKTGCTFMGWKIQGAKDSYWDVNKYNYPMADSSNASYIGRLWPSNDAWLKGTGKYGNLTLTAVWRIPITLNGNASSTVSGAQVTQTYSKIYYYNTFGYSATAINTNGNFEAQTWAKNSRNSVFNTFPTISGTGTSAYSFGGYFSGTASDTQYLSGYGTAVSTVNLTSAGATHIPSGPETWYARWFPNIGIYGNGGTLTWRWLNAVDTSTHTISKTGSAYFARVYKVSVGANSITLYNLYTDGTMGCQGFISSGEDASINKNILKFSNFSDGRNTLYGDYSPITTANQGNLFYAQWSKVTVSFDLNGGKGTAPNNVTAEYNKAMPALSTTAEPTKTGYWFAGWFDGSDKHVNGNNTTATDRWSSKAYYYSNGTSAATWDKTCDTTLYAGWVPIKYTIKYDANVPEGTTEATGTTKDTEGVLYDENVKLAENGFSRTGYTFLRWATKADATDPNTNWTSGATVSKPNLTDVHNSTVTLYAIWRAHTYTIKYDGNTNTGGSTANTSPVTWDKNVVLAKNGFEKTGYHFIGWAESANGDVVYEENKMTTTFPNLTPTDEGVAWLYAKWEPNIYTVSFDKNVADTNDNVKDMPDSFTIKFSEAALNPANETVNLSSNVPIRIGYKFQGWRITGTDSVGTSIDKVYKPGDLYRHPFASDMTFYAQWEENTDNYRINFYRFTEDGTQDKLELPGGYLSGELDYEERFPLPLADMVKDSDKVSGYYLYGWSWSNKESDVDGAKDTSYILPHTTSIREIFASLGIDAGDEEPKEVNLYAVWQMVYSVSAPTSVKTASIVLDASEKQVYRPSEITLESSTPCEIAVGAKSEYNKSVFEQVFPNTRSRNVDFAFTEKETDNTKYFPLDGASPYTWIEWGGQCLLAQELTRIPKGSATNRSCVEAYLSFDFDSNAVNISHELQLDEQSGLLMNGTRWEDPIAKITWMFVTDEASALSYTLLPKMPDKGSSPGHGEINIEADSHPFPQTE